MAREKGGGSGVVAVRITRKLGLLLVGVPLAAVVASAAAAAAAAGAGEVLGQPLPPPDPRAQVAAGGAGGLAAGPGAPRRLTAEQIAAVALVVAVAVGLVAAFGSPLVRGLRALRGARRPGGVPQPATAGSAPPAEAVPPQDPVPQTAFVPATRRALFLPAAPHAAFLPQPVPAPPSSRTTHNGLPVRRPGAQLIPGRTAPPPTRAAAGEDWRDPIAVSQVAAAYSRGLTSGRAARPGSGAAGAKRNGGPTT